MNLQNGYNRRCVQRSARAINCKPNQSHGKYGNSNSPFGISTFDTYVMRFPFIFRGGCL